MVLFLLYIKAELENVSSIALKRTVNLCFNVRNPLSDFETREKVIMNPSETIEQQEEGSSRVPPHHFSLKWEGNKKASTVIVLTSNEVQTILKKKKGIELPRDYTANDSGSWIPILAVDCRGLEPFAFSPMGEEFVITSTGGKTFEEDVDLGDGDWADYDEENDGTYMHVCGDTCTQKETQMVHSFSFVGICSISFDFAYKRLLYVMMPAKI